MRDDTLRFDILHNFISPVTGRILCTTDYVLVGNAEGIAEPSNIFGPIIPLFPLLESLPTTDFVIGHPNPYLPAAQVLNILADGIMVNTGGTVSTETQIPISSLPDLEELYVWVGDSTNRPAPLLYKNTEIPFPPTGLIPTIDRIVADIYGISGLQFDVFTLGAASLSLRNDVDAIQNVLEATVDNTIFMGRDGGDAVWSSAIYPATVTKNDILFAPADNVIGSLAGVGNKVLTTDSTGVPQWTDPTSGSVVSVTGTGEQIVVVNPTTTPVISIDPTYIGQTSITTLGTITTGTWNADPMTVPYGGTGDTSFTAYSLIAGGTTPTSNLQSLTSGTTGQVLTSQGSSSLPIWTTPSAGGVTSVSGTINQITATPTTGAVVLSLPTDVDVAGSINTGVVTGGFIQLVGSTLSTINTNGDLTINPNGSGNIIMVNGTSTGLVGIGTNAPLYLLDVDGITRIKRLLGNSNIPSVSLGSSAVVGSGATSSILGSEVGGIFTLTTGSSGISASGIVATFTLTNPMPSSTFSIVMSSGATGTPAFFALSTSSTTFTLSIDASLNINTMYIWNYQIVG